MRTRYAVEVCVLWSSVIYAGEPIITGTTTILWEGVTYQAIDDEGTYFVDLERYRQTGRGVPLPETRCNLRERYGSAAVLRPVVVELADYIDCMGTDHGFSDANIFPRSKHPNRPSRIMEVSGRSYRVTAAPDDGSATYYYRYQFANGPAGEPHLLMAESVNDQERYTSFCLNANDQTGWNVPYRGEPIHPWGEPWWKQNPPGIGEAFVPDVGVTFYTGRELPVDGSPYTVAFLFHPKSATTQVLVSSLGCNLTRGPNDGGAVSRIWVWRIRTPLPEVQCVGAGKGPERHLGVYFPHTWYLYAHHGTPVRTAEQRREGLTRLCRHLKFCGMDWIEFNAINGSDRSERAWYEGSRFFPYLKAGDILAELPPVAQAEGLRIVPVITSLVQPPDTDDIAWSDDSFQIGTNGEPVRAFGVKLPDPLRPEVQETVLRLVDEIGVRVKGSPSVAGIGIRVNGKIGLCYAAHQDSDRGSRLSGYSRWNIDQFRAATGLNVPMDSPERAYRWLNELPGRWDAWVDFRCRKMREFWLALRDRIRTYNPEWRLYVKCVLPSEVPGTNIEWAKGEKPIELLRHAGYDPALYTKDEGIVIERTMMVAQDRFFSSSRWRPPLGSNHDNYRTFHFAPGLAAAQHTAQGRAVDLYHNYWEEHLNPFWEFGVPDNPDVGWFRTTTPTPFDRSFFRPITFSLREANVNLVVLTGWVRATLGQEHRLRRFAAAYRAIPDCTPEAFGGTVDPTAEGVWVRRYGDVIAVVNDTGLARRVTLSLDRPIAVGQALVDAGEGHVYIDAIGAKRNTAQFPMEPWSLRTLRVQPWK